jgi:hypothetical protein
LLNYYKRRNSQKFGGTHKYFGGTSRFRGTQVEKHWFTLTGTGAVTPDPNYVPFYVNFIFDLIIKKNYFLLLIKLSILVPTKSSYFSSKA